MKRSLSTLDITYAAMFVALMAIGANIVSWMPFLQIGGVPLSMQPFFCVLAGILLGSRLGAISMIVYLLVGIAGAPVFAQFSSGFATIVGPTGGFLLSYVVTAFVAGLIVEKKAQPNLGTFMIASFVGIILIYVIGTNYMFVILNYVLEISTPYVAAWATMTLFAVKDVVFTILCAMLASRLFYVVHKTTKAPHTRKAA
ncbi:MULTISPECIES: biotin transporter BioY [unclassified Bacillus (in: firmicutes)]|jgi:biotin transport system substrate-specific component|uniref:biotin transporter BioY n=1 Tax=unclassified Bacillus (in: firmicutes) TaxID=185979 RepID=UPI0006CCC8B8|nr:MULTISPECIES: biotin transporter BioY [unclassified Bacillus (in: firmicutes)]KPB04741.1 biotin biosynthesis protein BioC [Bacillus sp. CHD6a]MEA3320309.1 biotin transporter BioY [Bacillota bacterium]NMH75431.1 biotin transporter BioY [Bacillus sp. RO2]